MKQILLSIQQRLTELNGLRYIDRDWGQLQYEQPPVQFPCVLIDVANIDFTQQGRGAQLGEATVTVTIANINPVPSSALAPDPAASYGTIDLLEEVHQKLQLFSDGSTYNPLMRTNLQKTMATADYEVYQMSYKTAFVVPKVETGVRYVTVGEKITVNNGNS